MIPIIGPAAVREADAWTLAHEPITSWALMERAAKACVQKVLPRLRAAGSPPVMVVAGMGNSGGDGLAMARLLAHEGLDVMALRIRHRTEPSDDNARNAELLVDAGLRLIDIETVHQLPELPRRMWIIDALIGSGLSAPLTGLASEAVGAMNRSGCNIISIDMPSGLFPESNQGNDMAGVVRARLTLTLELPKLSFMLPESGEAAGEWEVVPIGLNRAFINRQETSYHLVERIDAERLLPARPRFGHKGSFGHALVIGGCEGRMGAAVLATRACLRSGSGLVTAHVPRVGLDVLQSNEPQAMCSVDPGHTHITRLPNLTSYDAVGVGPGLGKHSDTAAVVTALLLERAPRLVLDADALNLLAVNVDLLNHLPEGAILTPHPKEFERLAGRTFNTGYERLQEARACAARWRCIIVLKGAWTAICSSDGRVHFNPTGNPGMAKGGSGDALTGLLTGLLAQGLQPFDACLLGTYIHGLAGDAAASRLGADGMTAMDIIDAIPQAWMSLRNGD